MAGGLWAEEDNGFVCELATKVKTFEEDILKCKKGDVLHIGGKYANLSKWALRACELESIIIRIHPDVICIYRGSLREVRSD